MSRENGRKKRFLPGERCFRCWRHPYSPIADMAARGYDFVTAASVLTLMRDAALAQLREVRGG